MVINMQDEITEALDNLYMTMTAKKDVLYQIISTIK